LLPPLLEDEAAPSDSLRAIAAGLLLGAAFWQQPVAACYALAAGLALGLRRGPRTGARAGWMLAGAPVGVLPVLLWDLSHGWACLAMVWRTAAGAVYARPRYLLPLLAATAIGLGVVWSWAWARSRAAAVAVLALLLAVNVSGTVARLRDGGPTEDYYRRVLRSLDGKQVRTGYADFSLAGPVTMFTRGRILLSSRLGPTPAYEPDAYTRRVAEDGPDAYVLRPDDDPERFAAVLRALGVAYRVDLDPVPVFY